MGAPVTAGTPSFWKESVEEAIHLLNSGAESGRKVFTWSRPPAHPEAAGAGQLPGAADEVVVLRRSQLGDPVEPLESSAQVLTILKEGWDGAVRKLS